jgi:hypothetical protein
MAPEMEEVFAKLARARREIDTKKASEPHKFGVPQGATSRGSTTAW